MPFARLSTIQELIGMTNFSHPHLTAFEAKYYNAIYSTDNERGFGCLRSPSQDLYMAHRTQTQGCKCVKRGKGDLSDRIKIQSNISVLEGMGRPKTAASVT